MLGAPALKTVARVKVVVHARLDKDAQRRRQAVLSSGCHAHRPAGRRREVQALLALGLGTTDVGGLQRAAKGQVAGGIGLGVESPAVGLPERGAGAEGQAQVVQALVAGAIEVGVALVEGRRQEGVAQAGMLIRKSEYAGTSTMADVIGRLSELDITREDEYRKEFCELMKKVAID